jgi:hypothetical protein
MKVPSLRNVGLKATYMHTGTFASLDDVIDAYAEVPFKNIVSKLPNGDDYNFQFTEMQRRALIAFLKLSLTDLRVKKEQFPFDRPLLRTEQAQRKNKTVFENISIQLNKAGLPRIQWKIKNSTNVTSSLLTGYDIEIVRNDGKHYWVTNSPFTDHFVDSNMEYTYSLSIRNEASSKITTAPKISIESLHKTPILLYLLIGGILLIIAFYLVRLKRT